MDYRKDLDLKIIFKVQKQPADSSQTCRILLCAFCLKSEEPYGWMCFYIFLQISYDLTGSLSRNKDALPQNLVFTMKCKYPVKMCTWAHRGVRAHLMHSFPHAAHKSPLCQRVIIFVFIRVSSRTADSTGCVLVVNTCCQMWSDFIGGTQAGLVRLPGSPYTQQPNCCNPCDGANLLNAGPLLLLGRCPFVWMRRCILTSFKHYHICTVSFQHLESHSCMKKGHACLENYIYVSGQWSHCMSVAAHSGVLKWPLNVFVCHHPASIPWHPPHTQMFWSFVHYSLL